VDVVVEPFGSLRTETKASGSQPANFLKFTGEYLDPTGLYHLRARQYDPAVGRLLTADPAGQTVNESVISAYLYVGDRPTVMVDPSGAVLRLQSRATSSIGRYRRRGVRRWSAAVASKSRDPRSA
jgi:RHS repeat-associated protein